MVDTISEYRYTRAVITRNHARTRMIQLGWSQRRAAKHLGITQTHLCLVLCGKRESRSLLTRIAQLPPAPFIPHGSPYMKQQTKTKAQTQAGNGAHDLLPMAPKSRRVQPPASSSSVIQTQGPKATGFSSVTMAMDGGWDTASKLLSHITCVNS
jgi:hypothetical protein